MILPYFQAAEPLPEAREGAGAESGSDGGRGPVWHPIEIRE